jgi:hypothetical protein
MDVKVQQEAIRTWPGRGSHGKGHHAFQGNIQCLGDAQDEPQLIPGKKRGNRHDHFIPFPDMGQMGIGHVCMVPCMLAWLFQGLCI